MNTDESNTEELYRKYVLANYAQAPLTINKGVGVTVWDDTGREYLDFTSGIAVTTLGHCHPRWLQKITDQAAELAHCSNLFRNPNQGLLAEKLVQRAGPGKAFFCNSGAEANETLIKLARLHGREQSGTEEQQYKILAAKNAFHGRTMGSLAATPQEKIQGGFRPMLDGFAFGEINNIQSFTDLVDKHTAAILIEPIQGESGILSCSKDFLRELRELCDERGLLLLLDEVQCGIGRTGSFFAFEHAGIHPDAIAMAKGLGGGFPIGAVWIAEPRAHLFTPGSHGSTFGGSPMACAAALAVLEVLEQEDLLHRVAEQSKPWLAALRELAVKFTGHIKEVRGRGYLVALAFHDNPTPIIVELRNEGLLTVGAGDQTVRLLPPLTATSEELQRSVDILEKVLVAAGT